MTMVPADDFVDVAYELLEKRDPSVFWEDKRYWDVPRTIDWLKAVDEL